VVISTIAFDRLAHFTRVPVQMAGDQTRS